MGNKLTGVLLENICARLEDAINNADKDLDSAPRHKFQVYVGPNDIKYKTQIDSVEEILWKNKIL